jgi:hypothetical protein
MKRFLLLLASMAAISTSGCMSFEPGVGFHWEREKTGACVRATPYLLAGAAIVVAIGAIDGALDQDSEDDYFDEY